MECVSKNPASGKNYWIENYTDKQKEAFLEIGFELKEHTEIEKRFGISDYLFFKGTGEYGFWNEVETAMIDGVVCELLQEDNFDIWEAVND